MSYLAVDEDGEEGLFDPKPIRGYDGLGFWYTCKQGNYVEEFLPIGSIEKLIGRKLTWKDEPVNLLG
jgi:hypothetical protein